MKPFKEIFDCLLKIENVTFKKHKKGILVFFKTKNKRYPYLIHNKEHDEFQYIFCNALKLIYDDDKDTGISKK